MQGLSCCALIALIGTTAAGCTLPLRTAAPESATTLGRGGVSLSVAAEAPTADLLTEAPPPDAEDDGTYDYLSFPMGSFGFAIGVHDRVDLEATIESVFPVIPIPYGATAGARVQVVEHDGYAVAAALRVGGFSGSSEVTIGEEKTTYDGSALVAHGSVAIEGRPIGWFRPTLAGSLIPARVRYAETDKPTERFMTTAMSATVALRVLLGPVDIVPFAAVSHIRSPERFGADTFFSYGLNLALRFGGKQSRSARIGEPTP